MPHSQAAALKYEIEAKLAVRMPAALSPRMPEAPCLLRSGIAEMDALLGGGIPVGGITELTGWQGSGRTALASTLMAGAGEHAACAYVDASDTFDPRSAAAVGVSLSNLLWVRFTKEAAARMDTPLVARTAAPHSRPPASGGHPRMEAKGLGQALSRMQAHKPEVQTYRQELPDIASHGHRPEESAAVTDTAWGTSLGQVPEEQVRWEHFNARRAHASDPLRQANWRAADDARQQFIGVPDQQPAETGSVPIPSSSQDWQHLDRVIRATDQILQSGGFRVVVLDLGSVPQTQATRIPSATWFRFRRATQEANAVLLVLTEAACVHSSAACVLKCTGARITFENNLLLGLEYEAAVARQRVSTFGRPKAPGRVGSWHTQPLWMGAVGCSR